MRKKKTETGANYTALLVARRMPDCAKPKAKTTHVTTAHGWFLVQIKVKFKYNYDRPDGMAKLNTIGNLRTVSDCITTTAMRETPDFPFAHLR